MDRKRVSEIIFHLSLLSILVWILLKSIGVINTPFWLEIGMPLFGLVIALFTLYDAMNRSIIDIAVGLAKVSVHIEHMSKDLGPLNKDVSRLKSDMGIVKKELNV